MRFRIVLFSLSVVLISAAASASDFGVHAGYYSGDLKQSDVAAKLELPASYLSKIENGTRRLDVIELIRIAEAMHTDPAVIVSELKARLAKRR